MTSVLSNNSTSTPLAGSSVFFGAWQSTSAFQAIKVSVLADQVGTLIIQHATTASQSNIVYEDTKYVNASTETFLEAIVKAAFFRVKYENGTDTQTSFKLQTTSGLQYGGDAPSLSVTIDEATSSIVVWGKDDDGDNQPLRCDASGNLVVKPVEISRIELSLFNGEALNPDTASPVYDVSQFRKCVLSYADTQTTSTKSLYIYGTNDAGVTKYFIGEILPIVNSHTGVRSASVNMDFSAFTGFQIVNESDETIGGIVARLFGSV